MTNLWLEIALSRKTQLLDGLGKKNLAWGSAGVDRLNPKPNLFLGNRLA